MARQEADLDLKLQSWRSGGPRPPSLLLPFIFCFLYCICLYQTVATDTSTKNWDCLLRVADMEGEELTEMLTPLLAICINNDLYPTVSEVQGWRPSSLVASLTGAGPGVRGLVYEEDDGGDDKGAQNATTKRAVLCFHGLRRDELADRCASLMLIHGYTYSSLPSECTTSFSESAYDYLSEAVAYISRALLVYPSPNLLISGNSFGCGLAIIAAANLSASSQSILLPVESATKAPPLVPYYEDTLSLPLDILQALSLSSLDDTSLLIHQLDALPFPHDTTLQAPPLPLYEEVPSQAQTLPFPVLVFSAVGTREALCQRGLPFPSSASLPFPSSSVVVIAQEWDPVVRSFWNDQVGLLCLYEADEIDECKACADESPPAGETGSPAAAPSPWTSDYCSLPEEAHPAILPDDGGTDCTLCATQTHGAKQLTALVDQGLRPVCKLMLVA